jgi:hypothetical protein
LYVLLLVAVGMVIYYYRARLPLPWPKFYLLAILVFQFILSAILAASATSASIRSEVVNRTLDFQRIAALSPRQILLGKLLGEPALAYLLAIASIPLAVWCCTLGVDGVTLLNLPLVYVTLATSTILISALGMMQPFEGQAKSASDAGTAAGWAIAAVVFLIHVLISTTRALTTPWSKAIVGLFSPVAALYGIYQGDLWRSRQATFSFFGLELPLLLATPVFQLLLAAYIFQRRVRQLINPLNPTVSKRMGYLSLAVVDVITAAVLFEPVPAGLVIEQRVTAFFLTHVIASLLLVTGMAPWRESLQSWIWRYRNRSSWLRGALLGERSEISLALAVFALLGVVGTGVLVLLPFGLSEGWGTARNHLPEIVRNLVGGTVVLFALGMLYQWCVAIAGRSGYGVFMTGTLLLLIPLHVVGYNYGLPMLLSLTASAQFASWLGELPPLPLWPILLLYGGIFLFAETAVQRQVKLWQRVVHQKLKQMGVAQAA